MGSSALGYYWRRTTSVDFITAIKKWEGKNVTLEHMIQTKMIRMVHSKPIKLSK
jgi:hypothetical protein